MSRYGSGVGSGGGGLVNSRIVSPTRAGRSAREARVVSPHRRSDRSSRLESPFGTSQARSRVNVRDTAGREDREWRSISPPNPLGETSRRSQPSLGERSVSPPRTPTQQPLGARTSYLHVTLPSALGGAPVDPRTETFGRTVTSLSGTATLTDVSSLSRLPSQFSTTHSREAAAPQATSTTDNSWRRAKIEPAGPAPLPPPPATPPTSLPSPDSHKSMTLPNVQLVERYEGVIANLQQEIQALREGMAQLRGQLRDEETDAVAREARLAREELERIARERSVASPSGASTRNPPHNAPSRSKSSSPAQSSPTKLDLSERSADESHLCAPLSQPCRRRIDRSVRHRLEAYSSLLDERIAASIADRISRVTRDHIAATVHNELRRYIEAATVDVDHRDFGTLRRARDVARREHRKKVEKESSRKPRARSPSSYSSSSSSPNDVRRHHDPAPRDRTPEPHHRPNSPSRVRAAVDLTDIIDDVPMPTGADVTNRLRSVVNDLEDLERAFEHERKDSENEVDAAIHRAQLPATSPERSRAGHNTLSSMPRPRSPEHVRSISRFNDDVDALLGRLRESGTRLHTPASAHRGY